MYPSSVKAPRKDRIWVYWVIRATSKEDHENIRWVAQAFSGRYRLYTDEAKRFKDLAEAERVAKYLQKRGDAASKWHEHAGVRYEVLKVYVEKKTTKEWPLDVLEKLAKV